MARSDPTTETGFQKGRAYRLIVSHLTEFESSPLALTNRPYEGHCHVRGERTARHA